MTETTIITIIGSLLTIISVFIGVTAKQAIKKIDEIKADSNIKMAEIKSDGDKRGEKFDIKIDKVQEDVKGAMNKLGELSDRVTTLTAERSNDRQNLTRLEGNISNLQGQLSSISAKVDILSQTINFKKLAAEAGIIS